jgi:hypothetical protein
MKRKGLLPRSQGPATRLYHEPGASTPHPPCFPKIHSNIFPSMPMPYNSSLSYRFSNQKLVCISCVKFRDNTPYRLFATTYSIYSQLPSISGDRLLLLQPVDAPCLGEVNEKASKNMKRNFIIRQINHMVAALRIFLRNLHTSQCIWSKSTRVPSE